MTWIKPAATHLWQPITVKVSHTLALALWLIAFPAAGEIQSFNVLVFSKTLLYRQASITNGIAATEKLGGDNNFKVAIEDSAQFTPETRPRATLHELASLDETTYKGGTMGRDHSIAWWQRFEVGRVGYTAPGYTEPLVLQHLLGGIQFPAGLKQAHKPLFNLDAAFKVDSVTAQDATVSIVGSALRIATGRNHRWPGVTLPAPEGCWDVSHFAYIALSVKNAGKNKVTVSCRADNPGADGVKNCVTGSVTLEPGQTSTLHVALKRAHEDKLDGKLFGMRGYPVAPSGAGTVDPKNVSQLLVFVAKPDQDHVFEISDIRASGTYAPPTAWVTDAEPFFPFIDTFGQYKHKDWHGKAYSVADLIAKREAEASELVAKPGPPQWDRFGGWTGGPQLAATGFFYVTKFRGKWWLVDPEGHLFWSHGIDCVRSLDTTPIAERESWFENFPDDETEFAEFFSKGSVLKGHYAGQSVKCFSFGGANLARKYGPDWKTDYRDLVQRRLRSWGLNTIGNWSDEATRLMRRTPYTDAVSSRGAKNIEGSDGYWGKFPDVFDPSFAEGLHRSIAAKKDKSANDPWCIGYFSDNEMSWGDELSLAAATLRSPSGQSAKRLFVAGLKAKYRDVSKLNAAWGAKHQSWDALLDCREAPDKAKAYDDLAAFYTRIAETYFRTVRDAIKAVAPKQLYLGCRFAWVNDRAAVAAAKYCDVVSYNLYRRSVADFKYPGVDKPLINGEFHFGALDRGMFHTGLVPVENQSARAQAYKDYVLSAVRHPQFVGTHWFQYKDQPTTGRVYDEENYQIGFVDIADTPYRETIAASREVASVIYETRLAR